MLTGTAGEPNMTMSAFGVLQGQVLNQTSAWWMHETQHIAPNALLAVPDPNVSIMRRCRVFPVEFVVRGYLTGMPRSRPVSRSVAICCMQNSECICSLCSRFPLHWVAYFPFIAVVVTGWLLSYMACGSRRQHRHVAVDALCCGGARVLRQQLPGRHAEERPVRLSPPGSHGCN